MFRNVLSDIVTLEYTLMRCIHWAVRFSLDRRASLQIQVTISDFLISSVNMEFVVCLLSFLENKMFGNMLLDIVTLKYTLMRCIHWAVRFS